MIRHTVMFTLKHASGTAEERDFLTTAKCLAEIPGVKKFEQLRQVSPKCDHHFGFSMEFDDDDSYQAYNNHKIHADFVDKRWIPEVAAFQEIDYIPLT